MHKVNLSMPSLHMHIDMHLFLCHTHARVERPEMVAQPSPLKFPRHAMPCRAYS